MITRNICLQCNYNFSFPEKFYVKFLEICGDNLRSFSVFLHRAQQPRLSDHNLKFLAASIEILRTMVYYSSMKEKLTVKGLIKEAKSFCNNESKLKNKDLYGVTDGKAVGTYIEHKFQEILGQKYEYTRGSSANGIDFPGAGINTDIKVTSIVQPQSSCPFKDARQKIYGLGYNLHIFWIEIFLSMRWL